jgi:hypothetical protein
MLFYTATANECVFARANISFYNKAVFGSDCFELIGHQSRSTQVEALHHIKAALTLDLKVRLIAHTVVSC